MSAFPCIVRLSFSYFCIVVEHQDDGLGPATFDCGSEACAFDICTITTFDLFAELLDIWKLVVHVTNCSTLQTVSLRPILHSVVLIWKVYLLRTGVLAVELRDLHYRNAHGHR